MKDIVNKIQEKRLLALLFCGISLLLLIGGVVYYNYESDKIKTARYAEIHTIAMLKSDLLTGWLRERQSDILVIAESPVYQDAVEKWLQNPGDTELKKKLIERLSVVKKRYNYAQILLTDSLGNLYLSTDGETRLDEPLIKELLHSSRSGEPLHTGFYRGKFDNIIHFDFISQLKNDNKISHNIFLIFRSNPEHYLFPLLIKWPGISETGETMIVANQGDSILFLSDLKFRKNSALNLKISIHSDSVPPLNRGKQSEGMHIGTDYRGEEVLSDISMVPMTDWFLVSKIDTSEIFSELNFKMIIITLGAILANLALFFGFGFIYNSNTKIHYRKLYQAEKDLNEAQGEFRETFYSIGEGVITTDSAGRVQQMNRIAEAVTGWTETEAHGKEVGLVFRIIVKDSGENVENPVTLTLKEGKPQNHSIPVLLVSRSGERFPITISSSPINGGGADEITGVVLVFRDISETEKQQQKLIDSEEKFSKAFYSSPDAILITDLDNGYIVDYNQGLLDLTGYTDEEISGNTSIALRMWKSPEYRKMIIDQVMKSGEISNLQIEYRYRDGGIRYGLFSAKLMEFAGLKCLLSIVKDITDRVEAEVELRDAKEKAEELNRAKASFFANMSHELRTPLHGVLGFSEVLNEQITDPETLEVVQSIHKSAMRLLNTLNLILDLARLEAHKEEINLEKVNICKTVSEDIKTFEGYAKSKGLTLEYNETVHNCCAMVDKRFLSSIVNNLVNNAIKFTRFGGVKVETGALDEMEMKWVYLKVTDTGIGITEKAKALIFDEFRQASEGFGRSFEGTGLGLSIVKKYVELIGGKILVESQPGKGTVFTVMLPSCEAPNVENEPGELPQNEVETIHSISEKKKKLLLVEDDDASAWFIAKVLDRFYEIKSTRTGEDGLELINTEKFDAFLLDINLGKGITGVDIAQKLQEDPVFQNIPVVAITAFGSLGQKELLLSSGFTHYISKPFSKKELLTFMQEVFDSTSKINPVKEDEV